MFIHQVRDNLSDHRELLDKKNQLGNSIVHRTSFSFLYRNRVYALKLDESHADEIYYSNVSTHILPILTKNRKEIKRNSI